MSQQARRTRRAGRVVLELYREYEPHVARAAQARGVTCTVGCDHCCKLPATATVPEMALVVEYLSQRSDWKARRPALERALEHHLHEYAGVNIVNETERKAFFSRQLACVFLKDHRCDIYPVRPAVCRYHLVVSPPENCALGAENPETARLDLSKLENAVAMKGASEIGSLTGGTLALAFVLAAERLGIELEINPELVRRAVMVQITLESTTPLRRTGRLV